MSRPLAESLDDSRPAAPPLPERIGPYRILQLLGEGSSGRVFLAQEEHPPRQVALKVLRAVAHTAESTLRFQREVELLAQLEHAGIARLYAAGVEPSQWGPVPYLAMEYVRGADLLRHAQAGALPLHARLLLLAAVCRIVHFAHTRGVIHRDLKPANILVNEHGQPKVLDFGVAQLARADARLTVAGEVLGTLPYMSAEQLAGGARGGDPRSDVYSLGVIAYELICGELPYPGLTDSSVIQALTAIRQGRVEKLGQRVPQARGDVDMVVKKAMAAEAAARYGSAAEFADDLERICAQQPVAARPASAGYVIGLLVRRHRAAAAALAVAVLAVLAGAGFSVRAAVQESRARKDAERHAQEADAVAGFMSQMLASAAPENARGHDVSMRQVAEQARGALDADRSLPPAVVVRLRTTLGETFTALGQVAPAIEQLSAAVRQADAAFGAGSDAARNARISLSAAQLYAGHLEEAQLQAQAAVASAGSSARTDIRAAAALADVRSAQDRWSDAIALLTPLLARARTQLGADDEDTLEVARRLASAKWRQGDYAAADKLQREVLARREALLGHDRPRTLDALQAVGLLQREWGHYDEAARIDAEVLAARRRIMGAEHLTTLQAEQDLASVYWYQKKWKPAQALAQHSTDGFRAQLGAADINTRTSSLLVGAILRDQGRLQDAEPLLRAAAQAADPDKPVGFDATAYNHYGRLLLALHRYADADAVYRKLLHDTLTVVGAEHPSVGLYRSNAAEAMMQLGRWREALEQLQLALPRLESALGHDHPGTQQCRERLARAQAHLHIAQAPP